jgi:hypothetical protein
MWAVEIVNVIHHQIGFMAQMAFSLPPVPGDKGFHRVPKNAPQTTLLTAVAEYESFGKLRFCTIAPIKGFLLTAIGIMMASWPANDV